MLESTQEAIPSCSFILLCGALRLSPLTSTMKSVQHKQNTQASPGLPAPIFSEIQGRSSTALISSIFT